MAEESNWKWWISSFAIPFAGLVVAIGVLYVNYRQYATSFDEIRLTVEKEWKPQIAKLENDLRNKEVTIALLESKLAARDTNFKPLPEPSPFPKFDFGRYDHLLKTEPSATDTLLEKITGFFKATWKPILPLAIITLLWMFGSWDKK